MININSSTSDIFEKLLSMKVSMKNEELLLELQNRFDSTSEGLTKISNDLGKSLERTKLERLSN